jgi:hypothetical protein
MIPVVSNSIFEAVKSMEGQEEIDALTIGLRRSSRMVTAWFRRVSIISAGNSASTSTCSASLRCSYPGLSLSFSSYITNNN